ncbi:GTPase [Mycobacterium asiaticum]|uniref:GTPase n=1 Tax=Mycobacterium asiaticum TaxID=1790 RepID=UPI000A533672|nr:GTPase [Mycobacterium asiaticum]
MLRSDEFGCAVAEALASGGIEIKRLVAQAEELTDAYAQACRASEPANHLAREFEGGKSTFAERVRQHVTDRADVLSTFNIAFFGRTGAGKSTLLSAFGQLDGSGVSSGESDWTTTVETIDWHGCRLYDTPGINGWGGRKSRDELEALARRAVEVCRRGAAVLR